MGISRMCHISCSRQYAEVAKHVAECYLKFHASNLCKSKSTSYLFPPFFFFFWQVEYPNQKLWLSVRLEYRMALEVPNFWFHDEGPKGRPERGE